MRIIHQDVPVGSRFPTYLSSVAGMELLDRMEKVGQHLTAPAAAYGNAWQLHELLDKAASEASDDNWDGDGSLKVDDTSLDCAAELIDALPPGFPLPDVEIGRRGEVMFEWRTGQRSAALISIYPDRTVGYAVIRSHARNYGREPFDGVVPNGMLFHLRSILH